MSLESRNWRCLNLGLTIIHYPTPVMLSLYESALLMDLLMSYKCEALHDDNVYSDVEFIEAAVHFCSFVRIVAPPETYQTLHSSNALDRSVCSAMPCPPHLHLACVTCQRSKCRQPWCIRICDLSFLPLSHPSYLFAILSSWCLPTQPPVAVMPHHISLSRHFATAAWLVHQHRQ